MRVSSGVVSRSVTRASLTFLETLSMVATSKSALGERVAPFSARESDERTSAKADRGLEPRY